MPPLPPLTKWLMIVCTAIFLVDQLLGNVFQLSPWFALWPLDSGMFYPWQVVSYAFVHSNFLYLIFNMLGLWMFGAELERLWGHQRYWQLLLSSVVAAAVVQMLLTAVLGSHLPLAGAQGALYGLLLAYAMVFPRRQFDLVGFLPMVLLMIPGQIFYTLGIVLFVLLLANRQAVPIPPVPVPAMTMVTIFGALALISSLTQSLSLVALAPLGGMLGAWLNIQYWRRGRGSRSRR